VAVAGAIDAHVHFWDPALLRYPWHDGEPVLERAYVPGDFPPFADGSIDGVVFVQADCLPSQSMREVEWVERLADEEPRILAIVAYADMLDEDNLGAVLDRFARTPRVVGVRHNIQGHPAGFAMQDAFVRGVREAGARGLTFDLCITAGQVAEVAALVARCPDTQFVLDHCGKPAIRDDAFAAWAAPIERLASDGRVHCKLSGLLTEARADQRNTGALRPYAEHVMTCFGPSRLIYGSDWPVSVLGGGTEAWRAITDALTAAWSEDERRAFLAGNATRFYGLGVTTHG
jgi:L-fuconolactonase